MQTTRNGKKIPLKGGNLSKHKVGKRKSKRPKRQPKCTLCTYYRWLGNNKGRKRHSYYRQQKAPELNNEY